MSVMKKFPKGIKPEYILGIITLVVVGFALFNYSEQKNIYQSPMTSGPSNLGFSDVIPNQVSSQTINGQQNNVSAVSSNSNVINKAVSNPSDLLPNDTNNSWANMNPVGNADLRNVSLLNPTQLTGINTQGSSLRKPN